jgi:uncharacterized protein (DUF302 family)
MTIKILWTIILIHLLTAGWAAAQGGLVTVRSSHEVAATADRLESALAEKGITLFARIDHAAGARRIGQSLPPTQLLIFGNPALGTPLIQRSRSIGIDLPLKALIWEDASGQVWFTYTAPRELARRHGITEMDAVIEKMEKALSAFAMAATLP